MMKAWSATQRFTVRVKGMLEMEGFVTHRAYGSEDSLIIWTEAYRVLSPYRNESYKTDKPEYTIKYGKAIAELRGPYVIAPIGEPIDEAELPYALVRNGSWWKAVKVPHVTLPEKLYDEN